MNSPEVYGLKELRYQRGGIERQLPNGEWIPCKPMHYSGLHSFVWRLQTTWRVFTGQYHALDLRK